MAEGNNEPGPAWGFGAIAPSAKPKPTQATSSTATLNQQLGPRSTGKPKAVQSKPSVPSPLRQLGVREKEKPKGDQLPQPLPYRPEQPHSEAQTKPKVGQPVPLPEPATEPKAITIPGKSLGTEHIKVATEGVKRSRLLDEAAKAMERSKASQPKEKPEVVQSTPLLSYRTDSLRSEINGKDSVIDPAKGAAENVRTSRLLSETKKPIVKFEINAQPKAALPNPLPAPRPEQPCVEDRGELPDSVPRNTAAEAAKQRWLTIEQKDAVGKIETGNNSRPGEVRQVQKESAGTDDQTKKAIAAFKMRKAAEEAKRNKAIEDAQKKEEVEKAERKQAIEKAQKAKGKALEVAKHRRAFEMAEKHKAFEAAAKRNAAVEQAHHDKTLKDKQKKEVQKQEKMNPTGQAETETSIEPTGIEAHPKLTFTDPGDTRSMNSCTKDDRKAIPLEPATLDNQPREATGVIEATDRAQIKGGPNTALNESETLLSADRHVDTTRDVVVPLRPEGASAPSDPSEDTQDGPSDRAVRVTFQNEVVAREYVKGSVPNAHFPKKLSKSTAVPVELPKPGTVSTPAIRPILKLRPTNDTSENADPPGEYEQVLAYLDACEDELKILEHSLPSQSSDPESIGYTREAIAAARHTIVEARFCEGRNEDVVYDACERTKQARDFHEETLRRVNGPTHFENFKRAVAARRRSDLFAWQRNAGTAAEDFFDDVPDGDEDAEEV